MSDERLARLEVLVEGVLRESGETKAAVLALADRFDTRAERESERRQGLEQTLSEAKNELKLVKAGVVLALLSGGGTAGALISKLLGGA